ncbi:MAG TPA: hypothetical protein EYN66_08130 [Myxococcales bacterium]|nr:hypothetical protein [Myxococcales bacterium]
MNFLMRRAFRYTLSVRFIAPITLCLLMFACSGSDTEDSAPNNALALAQVTLSPSFGALGSRVTISVSVSNPGLQSMNVALGNSSQTMTLKDGSGSIELDSLNTLGDQRITVNGVQAGHRYLGHALFHATHTNCSNAHYKNRCPGCAGNESIG